MGNGLPRKAAVGIPGKTVNINPSTYFIAKRMENVGILRPGAALMLAAASPKAPQAGATKRGKK